MRFGVLLMCHSYRSTALSDQSSLFTVWFGVLFIRQGLYQEGAFRFSVIIPEQFPDGDCPVSRDAVDL